LRPPRELLPEQIRRLRTGCAAGGDSRSVAVGAGCPAAAWSAVRMVAIVLALVAIRLAAAVGPAKGCNGSGTLLLSAWHEVCGHRHGVVLLRRRMVWVVKHAGGREVLVVRRGGRLRQAMWGLVVVVVRGRRWPRTRRVAVLIEASVAALRVAVPALRPPILPPRRLVGLLVVRRLWIVRRRRRRRDSRWRYRMAACPRAPPLLGAVVHLDA